MAIRSFNYTGRRRIRREEVSLQLGKLEDGTLTFDADLRLDEHHQLPDSAAVHIEAYRASSASWMRFGFGTVGIREAPPDRRLTEFDGPDGILFRVKVTETRHGLILAEADSLRPRGTDEKQARDSLLPVQSSKSLEDRIWRLDFENGPVLLVNSALGDWREVVRDRCFLALVMPAVLEEILVRVLYVDNDGLDEDANNDWRTRWLKFARGLPGVGELPDIGDRDSVDMWIETVVGVFCRKQGVRTRYEHWWNQGAV
jgi:hypothetical protein